MALIRLLQRKPDGEVVFREPTRSDVPAYAILSHTWGKEEVSFQDIESGAGISKAGWKKMEFCAKQAAADGLEYFWIDTCCIDKKNAVELSAAINSMFRWYQKAVRCYVYLSDVSTQGEGQDGQFNPIWEATFRKSRWFTRGWTLQELIAPAHVDFFSSEGEKLGDKMSLDVLIHNITGIERNALHNHSLSNFSIDERMSWAESRHTTIEEDKAYCLLGIFDVSMSLIYGEGKEKAIRRLQHEIHISYKGTNFEQFSVGLDLSSLPQAAQFVAREKELTEMQQILYGHNNRSTVVLHGLGGIGKTQLALAYAMRHEEKFAATFWLNANDEDSLRLSCRTVAQQILKYYPSTSLFTGVDLDDLDQVVYAVKAWLDLRKNTRWLMIYDNYDNPRTAGNTDSSALDLRRFLPGSNHGSIIITTRSAQVKQGQRLHVQKLLSAQEGLKILSNTSGRKDIENDPDAIALVKELDGLPLALSTAGAYLEHVTTSFSDYLRLHKASWLKLQTTSPRLTCYEDRSLYTTWQITFDRIEQVNAASAKLLKWWAYFDRQDVWLELLQHTNSADDQWIQNLVKDELNFNEAVTLLCSFGLVNLDWSPQQRVRSRGYSVHSCMHSWTVSVLNKEWDKSLARLALNCVASMIPMRDERDSWILQRRLLQHAMRQERFILEGKVDNEGIEWALHKLGLLYSDQGKLAEAEAMYIRALQGFEEALGPNHTSILNTVANLGTVYFEQGKLAEAEAMYIRALQGFKEALGPNHTSILNMVNNLGTVYKEQDKLAEAEAMYIRALQGKEEALGPNHTSTLNTVVNLGNLYRKQGKLAEAEAMYIRALQGYEDALGPQLVPSYLPALNTIFAFGNLLSQTKRKDMAKGMYTQALSGYTTVQGPSSKWCRQLEDRLQALQVTSVESDVREHEFTRLERKSQGPLKRKYSASWEGG